MKRAESRLRGARKYRGALTKRPGVSVGSLIVSKTSGDGGQEAEGPEGDGRGWSHEPESRWPQSHRTVPDPAPVRPTEARISCCSLPP